MGPNNGSQWKRMWKNKVSRYNVLLDPIVLPILSQHLPDVRKHLAIFGCEKQRRLVDPWTGETLLDYSNHPRDPWLSRDPTEQSAQPSQFRSFSFQGRGMTDRGRNGPKIENHGPALKRTELKMWVRKKRKSGSENRQKKIVQKSPHNPTVTFGHHPQPPSEDEKKGRTIQPKGQFLVPEGVAPNMNFLGNKCQSKMGSVRVNHLL